MRPVLRRMKFWLAWYVPLFGLWLLFVDTLAAVRARWLRGLWVLPRQVLTDSWLLAVALWRQLRRPGSVRGLFRVLPFPIEGDDAVAAARGALVTGLVSVAPNTYVVGIERNEGFMLVHQLARRRGGEVPGSMLER